MSGRSASTPGDIASVETMVRPELITLSPADRDRVGEHVTAKGGHCQRCGGTDFDIGRALYLGYLFFDEDEDAYLIALTCRNPDCAERTAIRLSENDFLSRDQTAARAATWLASAPSGA